MKYHNEKYKILASYSRKNKASKFEPNIPGFRLAANVQSILLVLSYILAFLSTTVSIPDNNTPERTTSLIIVISYLWVIAILNTVTLVLVKNKPYDKAKTFANIVISYMAIIESLSNIIYHLSYKESKLRIAFANEYMNIEREMLKTNFAKDTKKYLEVWNSEIEQIENETDFVKLFVLQTKVREVLIANVDQTKLAKINDNLMKDAQDHIAKVHRTDYLILLAEISSTYSSNL